MKKSDRNCLLSSLSKNNTKRVKQGGTKRSDKKRRIFSSLRAISVVQSTLIKYEKKHILFKVNVYYVFREIRNKLP